MTLYAPTIVDDTHVSLPTLSGNATVQEPTVVDLMATVISLQTFAATCTLIDPTIQSASQIPVGLSASATLQPLTASNSQTLTLPLFQVQATVVSPQAVFEDQTMGPYIPTTGTFYGRILCFGSNGALVSADSLPSLLVKRNGITMVATTTGPIGQETGSYEYTVSQGTGADAWADGDQITVICMATIGGIASAKQDSFTIGTIAVNNTTTPPGITTEEINIYSEAV